MDEHASITICRALTDLLIFFLSLMARKAPMHKNAKGTISKPPKTLSLRFPKNSEILEEVFVVDTSELKESAPL